MGIKRVWMHQGEGGKGAYSAAAHEFCKQNGIGVVYGFCPMMFFPVGIHKLHFLFKKWGKKLPPEYSSGTEYSSVRSTPPYGIYRLRGLMVYVKNLRIGAENMVVGKGDSWLVPSNVGHGAGILEDSVALEVFTPPRKSLLG